MGEWGPVLHISCIDWAVRAQIFMCGIRAPCTAHAHEVAAPTFTNFVSKCRCARICKCLSITCVTKQSSIAHSGMSSAAYE